jgi:hypothetical protein
MARRAHTRSADLKREAPARHQRDAKVFRVVLNGPAQLVPERVAARGQRERRREAVDEEGDDGKVKGRSELLDRDRDRVVEDELSAHSDVEARLDRVALEVPPERGRKDQLALRKLEVVDRSQGTIGHAYAKERHGLEEVDEVV